MSYPNCDAAYAAGYSNIPKSSPNYSAKLDRDKDGIACDNPPAGFVARKETETSTGTKVENGAGTGDRLPQTGPGEVTAIGAIVLAMGAVVVMAFRRRRTRFVS
jgi:LPXTG-motif cell wall-anchored protein